MQILGARFDELKKELQTLQAADGPALWQGLILGLSARGLSADSRMLRDTVAAVLNDGQPLPGALIAIITELAIDAQDGFNKDNLPLMLPKSGQQARLQALADLCYGLTLGLAYDPKAAAQQVAQKVSSPQRLEFLRTLQQLQQVDPDSSLEEEDFQAVLDFIESELLREHNRSVKAHA